MKSPLNPLPLSHYAKVVRAELPADAFAPHPGQLVWLFLHLAICIGGAALVIHRVGGYPGMLLWALLIGHSMGGLGFVGHEILHGSVVRSMRARAILGWISFLPFSMSPRMWIAWHNRVHHGNTMRPGADPDMYPLYETYKESKALQFADFVSFGRNRLIGWVTLLFGFTGMSTNVLLSMAHTPEFLGPKEVKLAYVESALSWAFWAAVAFKFGFVSFAFIFLLPLIVANFVAMSYIYTNHQLSPHTEINDPLINSLSVTTFGFLNKLHVNFGLHVEHHLFPSLSSVHAEKVRDLLVKHWPDRYQAMPHFRALRLLYSTPRVYADAVTLMDPETGAKFSTLLPREAATTEPRTRRPSSPSPIVNTGALSAVDS
jgi:fatty acid desaturase